MTRPVGENMHASNLYAVLTMVALVGILPLALLVEGRTIVGGTLATIEKVGLPRLLWMLLASGVSHYVYNECAPPPRARPPLAHLPSPCSAVSHHPLRPLSSPPSRCAFLALSSIHPVTHAVANTLKRIAVIVVTVPPLPTLEHAPRARAHGRTLMCMACAWRVRTHRCRRSC